MGYNLEGALLLGGGAQFSARGGASLEGANEE